MLVLSRKQAETLVIGDGIRITVLRVDRNQVRLGIEAPNRVPVLRAELLERSEPAETLPAPAENAARLTPAPVVRG